ncbi:C2H2-type domain-containing protein [Caenorhabditis elegans]|uniref:C2H2-type domain-containing protein n=1 Tax=Caenorhabditis elegans TaxID=6239 RepID=Q20397_CAEEL|nr:C2H2-type domain-containing protein [Caenorhabditis elegans]CAA92606.2 C2H2-type domain-containing protein [Caenorhabditis elegans]|eukprot:NP_501814.2 Uncharacterized protein CELE_F44D12.10 [Caenorhabditis elegans]
MKEALNTEREKTDSYRLKWLDQMRKMVFNMEEENGEPFDCRICEICAAPYREDAMRAPRVLPCDHTICTDCAGHFVQKKQFSVHSIAKFHS